MHAPRKPVGLLLRNQWKNVRFHGWRWIPYQAGDMGARLWRAPGRAAPLRVDDLYAKQTLQTVRGLRLRLDELGIDLTCEAVADALDGKAQAQPQPAGGKTYRKPTLAQDAGLQRALLRRQAPDQPLLRRVLKDGVATTMHAAWQAGLGRLLAPRLTCLLYHRVSDAVRDNLTVGIEQFDRQMALLRRHCDVVSVEEAMAMAQVPRSGRPLVCVSFDDGYLDNYTNAAQILLRHQIPAAFFVTTGLIGTERAFPHDVRRGNPPIPMMEWEHVRSMRDCGFTIGSHSVHHVDCAAEPEDVVWRELVDSRDTLRREVGLDGMLFAYPYGKRQNMTPERLELVKRAGYGGCLSAYGGANTGAVDRWNLLRRGIHWEFSDSAFLYACLGL